MRIFGRHSSSTLGLFSGSVSRLSCCALFLVCGIVCPALGSPLFFEFFMGRPAASPEQLGVFGVLDLRLGENLVPVPGDRLGIADLGCGTNLRCRGSVPTTDITSLESARVDICGSLECVSALTEVCPFESRVRPQRPDVVLFGGNLFKVIGVATSGISAQVVGVHTLFHCPSRECHCHSMGVVYLAGDVQVSIPISGNLGPGPAWSERMLNHGALASDPVESGGCFHSAMITNIGLTT